MEAQTDFAELPEEEQPAHMGEASSRYVEWMVDYICQHREPVKLLLCRAEGTSYGHFSTMQSACTISLCVVRSRGPHHYTLK